MATGVADFALSPAAGAALAVATGVADFALAVDRVGEARVPAACCSVVAYRSSPGVLPAPAGSSSGSSGGIGGDCLALITTDALAALKVAEVLGAPGEWSWGWGHGVSGGGAGGTG